MRGYHEPDQIYGATEFFDLFENTREQRRLRRQLEEDERLLAALNSVMDREGPHEPSPPPSRRARPGPERLRVSITGDERAARQDRSSAAEPDRAKRKRVHTLDDIEETDPVMEALGLTKPKPPPADPSNGRSLGRRVGDGKVVAFGSSSSPAAGLPFNLTVPEALGGGTLAPHVFEAGALADLLMSPEMLASLALFFVVFVFFLGWKWGYRRGYSVGYKHGKASVSQATAQPVLVGSGF